MKPLAFVDLETTGPSAHKDRITEVGIVLLDDEGVRTWSQVVNPGVHISHFIEQLTGITNTEVQVAPRFESIAQELHSLLDGRLFIAHNARFDYSFLKNEFLRLGMTFKPAILCTVKLSRALYPEYRHHGLDHLVERHGLSVTGRHRALADADLIHQFWEKLKATYPEDLLDARVHSLTQRSSLPSHIDPAILEKIPDRPGVYRFFGENELPLYIGKSIHLKQRVLSHFAADHSQTKEMSLSQQTKRIDWIETQGELGALLLEAKLIKEMLPIHNRRLRRKSALCTWQLVKKGEALVPNLKRATNEDFDITETLYGLYASEREAQRALRTLATDHQLCLSLLGIEKITAGRPCFAQQINRCRGACCGKESLEEHNKRLLEGFHHLQLSIWPYGGPIGIREDGVVHVIHQWCYLGTVDREEDWHALISEGTPVFDRDTYQLLRKALKTNEAIIL